MIGTSVIMFLIVIGFIYAMVRDITTWEMFYDNPVSIDSVVVGNEKVIVEVKYHIIRILYMNIMELIILQ